MFQYAVHWQTGKRSVCREVSVINEYVRRYDTLFKTKIDEIDTPFKTIPYENHTLSGRTFPLRPYKGGTPGGNMSSIGYFTGISICLGKPKYIDDIKDSVCRHQNRKTKTITQANHQECHKTGDAERSPGEATSAEVLKGA